MRMESELEMNSEFLEYKWPKVEEMGAFVPR